jgi:tRNA-splicing ligase RtcB
MQLNTGMNVNRIADEVWEIPTSEKSGMLVPARIYGTPGILQSMDQGVFDQVTNVACLPAFNAKPPCMPDGLGGTDSRWRCGRVRCVKNHLAGGAGTMSIAACG